MIKSTVVVSHMAAKLVRLELEQKMCADAEVVRWGACPKHDEMSELLAQREQPWAHGLSGAIKESCEMSTRCVVSGKKSGENM